jgi:selenocysteine-specific elongation factor
MDRLPEERRRGITITLGFAPLTLPDGTRVGVVDVPGHEKLVRTMVAGAGGLDVVLLVVAADEGVMPQTREHLEICQLLGVPRALVALTKIDKAGPELTAMALDDVRAHLAGTSLADAPIVPCSALTGEGLDALRDALVQVVAEVQPGRRDARPVALPIDRAFSVKGFGTVVTGTILGGELAVGDELQVLPEQLPVRVRGIEVHGGAVEKAVAGHRAAINLGGIAVEELARGDVLAHPDRVAPSHILDVELRYLRSAPGPLPTRSKVLVHHGTTQVLATLVLVDKTHAAATPVQGGFAAFTASLDDKKLELQPGERAIAQLRIDATTPLAALPGDHFIVRGFSKAKAQGSTIGGGVIVRVQAPKARTKTSAAHAGIVTTLAGARLEQRIAVETKTAAFAGLGIGQLVQRLGLPAEALAAALESLVAGGELMPTGEGEHAHFLHASVVAELEGKITASLGADGVVKESLRTGLPAALPSRAYEAVLAGLERRGKIALQGDRITKASAPPRAALTPVDSKLLEQLAGWKLEPPRPKDMPPVTALTEPQINAALAKLVANKLAVKIKPDYYLHAGVLDELRVKLLAYLDAHKTIDAQGWKEITGASRKFSIPLAEHFDAEKLTLRIGDVRRKR